MITQIDFCILNSIQNLRCGFLDFIMPIITYLGSGGLVWVVTSVTMLFFCKTRKTGFALGAALVLGYVLSTILLKNFIARERPFNTEGALFNVTSLIIDAPSDRFSFPSGHSLSSISSAVILLYYHKKNAIAALILALLIAFSRMYLYVHFPSDVVAGGIMGVAFGFAGIFITEIIWRIYNERKLPKNSG